MSTLNKDHIVENLLKAFTELNTLGEDERVARKNLDLHNEGFFKASRISDYSRTNNTVLCISGCNVTYHTPSLSASIRPYVKIMNTLAGVHSYKDGVAEDLSICTFDEYRFQYSTYMSTEIMIGLECLYTLYKNNLTPKGTSISLYCDNLDCLENIYE
ncbi:hypothetical protein XaC1_73 [Xanthomonas phage XaC1]|nr:hypothetical protein XaC1_73 [Xanthomonas phage XaC1]